MALGRRNRVGRAPRDAKQQGGDGAPRRALARLVRTVDEVQPRRGEVERRAGEVAPRDQVDTRELHESPSGRRSASRTAPRALARASSRQLAWSASRSALSPGGASSEASRKSRSRFPAARAPLRRRSPRGAPRRLRRRPRAPAPGGRAPSRGTRSRRSPTPGRGAAASRVPPSPTRASTEGGQPRHGDPRGEEAPPSAPRAASATASLARSRTSSTDARVGRGDRDVGPPHRVERARLDSADLPVLDRDQRRPLGADFACVAPLKVAGEDDPRVGGDDLARVHVPERPVGVSLLRGGSLAGPERRARAQHSVDGGLQEPHVEQVAERRGAGRREVVAHRARAVALAVDGEAEVLEDAGLGRGRRQLGDVLAEAQVRGDHAGRVVVPADEHDPRARLAQARELQGEIEARAKSRHSPSNESPASEGTLAPSSRVSVTRLSSARRVAWRRALTGAPSYQSSPRSGLSTCKSAAWTSFTRRPRFSAEPSRARRRVAARGALRAGNCGGASRATLAPFGRRNKCAPALGPRARRVGGPGSKPTPRPHGSLAHAAARLDLASHLDAAANLRGAHVHEEAPCE